MKSILIEENIKLLMDNLMQWSEVRSAGVTRTKWCTIKTDYYCN